MSDKSSMELDPRYRVRAMLGERGHWFRDYDFTGGHRVLWKRHGMIRGSLKYAKAYITALRIVHRQGYGYDFDMALKFLSATVNWSRRRRNAE